MNIRLFKNEATYITTITLIITAALLTSITTTVATTLLLETVNAPQILILLGYLIPAAITFLIAQKILKNSNLPFHDSYVRNIKERYGITLKYYLVKISTAPVYHPETEQNTYNTFTNDNTTYAFKYVNGKVILVDPSTGEELPTVNN